MKKRAINIHFVTIAIFLLCIVNYSNAQSPALGDYQSHSNGSWNVASTWERFDGAVWVTGAGVPASTDGVITIQNTHTVTVTGIVLADQVIVNSGGTISIQAGATLNIANGVGTDLDVNGAFVAASGSTIDGAGLISINSGASFTWGGGTMQGSGTTAVLSGATAVLNGGAKFFVGPRTLSNASANFTLSAADVQIQSGNNGIINNSGTITITDDHGFVYVNFTGCVFTNTGTITKTGGTGTGSFLGSGTVNMAFHNQGTVNVNSGTIRLGANGTHTGVFNSSNSSIFSIESSAITFTSVCSVTGNPILNFPGGGVYTFNSGCTIAPAVSVNHSNGTVNWDNSPTFSSYSLSANGNMAGNGIVSISGAFNWSGGNMSGSGTTAILSSATAVLNGGAKTFIGPRTLSNASPNFTLSSAYVGIASGNNGIINNSGTITITDDNGFAYVSGFGCVFTNTGTITKTGGTGTGSFLGSGTVNMAFHNQGTVNVNSGTIRLGANGTHTGVFNSNNNSTLSIESSAITFTSVCSVTGNPILNFPGGGVYTFNSGCTIAPAVSVNHSNGTVNWDNSPTFSSYTLSTTNSNMAGSGIVSISSAFNWTGGNMSGSGTTAILSSATAVLNGGAKTFVGPRTLSNASSNFTLSSTNVQIASGNNGIINNSGTITIPDDNGFAYVSGFGTVITNTGTITKTGGTGTGSFLGSGIVNMAFHNQGTVNVNSGTIRFGCNGTHTGLFTGTTSNSFSFEGGTHTCSGTSSFSGTVNLNFTFATVTMNNGCSVASTVIVNQSNGTITWDNSPTLGTLAITGGGMQGSGNVSVSGAFSWSGGAVMQGTGTTTIQNGATATFANGTLAGTRIFNNASANFTHSGILTFASSAPVFNNSGAINLNGDFGFHTNSVPAILNNLAGGIITKTAGTGTSNLMSGSFGIFNNSGIVNVNSGTINISGGGTHGGTYNVAAGKTLTGGNVNYSGPAITNNGNITLTGLTFSGSSNQTITGTGNINTLTINNSNNVTLLGGNHTINNSIQFTNGKFDINNNDLVIASAATITTPGNSSYIKANANGRLIRRVNNNATDVLFPVGGGANYLPVTIQFTAGSTPDSIKVRLTDNLYSSYDVNDNPTSLAIPQNVVKATYFISEVTAGGSNATVKLQWNAANESAGFSRTASRFGHYIAGAWSLSAAVAASGSNPYTLTQNAITSFSPFGVIGQYVDCSGPLGPYCVGQTYAIPYTAVGTYNAGNIFTVQLSDATGSFASPVNIGSVTSTSSGSINSTIPIATIVGTGYRVRVTSSNPVTTSENNGIDISINVAYSITATAGANGTISPNGNTSVCGGSNQAYTITPDPGYHIADVLVDGVSNAGAISSGTYTFINVLSAHTISATFASNCVAPTIICPANQAAYTGAGLCNAIVNYPAPTVGGTSPTLTYTSTGATILSGSGSGSGSLFNAGVSVVTITAANGCGSQSCSFNITVTDNQNPVITCTGTVNITNDAGFCTGTTTLTAPSATDNCLVSSVVSDHPSSIYPEGTTVVTWTATDNNGNTAQCAQNVVVAVNHATAPTNITSSATNNEICTGSTVILTANGASLGTAGGSYKWYEGGCGTGAVLGSSPILSRTPTVGSHTYYVRIEEACGSTGCVSITILVTATQPAGTVHYTSSIDDGCVGAPAATISVNAVSNCTFYNWTCTQAGVRFNGFPSPYQTTVPNVNVTFVSLPATGSSGWSICVFGGNACGNTNIICKWVRATVSMPTSILGSVIGCPGSSGNAYSSSTVAGAASYQWSSSGGIVINGNGAQAITVDFPAGFVSGTLSVHGQTACGYNGPNRTISINRAPAQPANFSGPSYPCPNATVTYSVAAVAGAANYTWSTTVPGAVVTGTTNSCSIAFPATIPAGSSVSVVANSSCPFSSAARSKGIASGLPNTPAAISGPATGQCGATGVSYSITPVALATGYNWSASCGTIQGPNNLSGLTIDWPASFTTCTLTVSASNACGSGGARALFVTGAPATPTVVSGNAFPCAGATEIYTASSTGATSFNWTIPAGSSILGPVNGGTIILQWGSTSGNVSAQAVNACGGSGFRALACVISCRQSQVTGSASGLNAEVYPNPATEKATVKFTATTASKYHLNMTDVIGRNVLSTDGTASEGINMIDLDLVNFAKGVYMINIMSGDNNEQIRVVVE